MSNRLRTVVEDPVASCADRKLVDTCMSLIVEEGEGEEEEVEEGEEG